MPDQGYGLRPEVVRVEDDGCRVEIVDPVGILAAARVAPVEVLHGARFPDPIAAVRLTVEAGSADGPVHVFRTEIRARGAAGTSRLPFDPVQLGIAGPVGVLLGRAMVTKDPLTRIAAGAGLVAFEAYRQLSVRRPAPVGVDDAPRPAAPPALSGVREESGLRATVSDDASAVVATQPGQPYPTGDAVSADRTVTLVAEVPAAEVGPAHLVAAARQLLAVVREFTGTAPLAGLDVRLSRYPDGRWGDAVTGSENVRLDDVGGLPHVVAQLRETAISFQHPDVMARWGARRPQGILLYGPPGTGKTMLARALANEIGAKFREIRTPEILDKWLGGSERNIKRIFAEARRFREPTVMLFDEFDSIISYTGAAQDSAGQAINSVAGIFKQEMNTLIEDNPNVIVVATTNFPQRVDESLVRSGRFDIKMSIPLPDQAGRAEIITKMVRQLILRHETGAFRMFADDVDPAGLAAVSAGMTGADIKEVLRRVQLAKAMREAQGRAVTPIGQADLIEGVAELRRAGHRAS